MTDTPEKNLIEKLKIAKELKNKKEKAMSLMKSPYCQKKLPASKRKVMDSSDSEDSNDTFSLHDSDHSNGPLVFSEDEIDNFNVTVKPTTDSNNRF